MAIPSRQIGWSTEDNLLWQISKQLERLTQVTGNSVSGSQTLTQTLVIGNNTGGNDILLNSTDAIQLENNSSLRKGTYDFGQGGGVSRICGVDYEDMWQGGIRHVFDSNGFIRNSSNCFNIIPNSSFDDTLRFKIGSFWTLDDGTTYECTDATTGAAVWELYSTPPKYQVFTALLTQSGGDDGQLQTSGDLTIGVSYIISNDGIGYDFTNVGAPNNDLNTWFIATGTTPNSWGTGGTELSYNTGAPVATVLENTIGNIWFNYEDAGAYGCQSNDLFTAGKTFILATPTLETGTVSITVTNGLTSVIYINPLNNALTQFNNGLLNTPIEIRVYN
jgi:hypothetical protein